MENDILGNEAGLQALEAAVTRSTDTLLKRKKKRRIIDLDSTEDPAHGKQEGVAYNGHFAKNCFHPLFGFTSEGDCLRAKLRPGNVHSADGVLEFIKPVVCTPGRRFPSISPLPGGVGLGLIGRRLTKNLLAKGVVCKKFRENYFFSEICAIMPSTRQFGYKKRGLSVKKS